MVAHTAKSGSMRTLHLWVSNSIRCEERRAKALCYCSPISDIREATSLVKKTGSDILISVGGGSPVDSAKAIAYTLHKDGGHWLPNIAIPTTLSVAETTQNAGYTDDDGHKVAVTDPEMVPKGPLRAQIGRNVQRGC